MPSPRGRLSRLGVAVVTAAVVFAALLVAPPARATETPPLTAERIESYLASLPDVRTWADAQGDTFANQTLGDDAPEAPYSAAVAGLSGTDAYDDLDDTLAPYGFDTPEDWAATADRILRALVAVKMQANNVTPEQLERVRQQVMQNDSLTPEQKEQIVSTFSLGAAAQSASAEDIAAVRPYADKLDDELSADDE